MTIEAELFDGTVLEFPDGTSPDVVKRVAKEQTAARRQQAQPAPYQPETDAAKEFADFASKKTHSFDQDPASNYGMRSLATKTAFLEGLPIVGPSVSSGINKVSAAGRSLVQGGSYDENLAEIEKNQRIAKQFNPDETMVGNVSGQVVGSMPAALAAPKYFGMTGNLASRIGYGAASNASMSGADTAVRGGSLEDIGKSAALGGTVGALVPGLGTVVYRATRDRVGSAVGALVTPEREAARRIASTLKLDRATPGGTMFADDFLAARRNVQPIVNADLGGEATRALARNAANFSPEARSMMEGVAGERFNSQGDRVIRLINRVSGGRTDDLLAQDGLRDAAAAVNKSAYDRAYASKAAQAMYPREAQELMQSPAFRDAVRATTTRGGDRAAAAGYKAVRNPFHEAPDGSFKLRRKADGTLAMPTLQFWDQVKRNLDGAIGTAQRSGDKTLVADLTTIKNKMVSALDNAVPEYKAARQGAARFFGAEDALEAGKKFAKSTRMIPEYKRGIMSMKGPERELFETGYASELIDAARNAGDRTNVITKLFRSPEQREKMVMAFGRDRAREIEAFVRVETAMDTFKNAFGNSTTARQLIEAGIMPGAGGAGTWWYTGDFRSGIAASAAIAVAKAGGRKIDANVMRKTADILLSDNPQMIARAVKLAAKSPPHMAAVDALGQLVALGARGAALAAGSQGAGPQ